MAIWKTYNVPRRAQTELTHLLAEINRSAVLKRKTRLRCREHGLQPVRQVYSGAREALLECECKRTIATLGAERLLARQIANLEQQIKVGENQ